VELKAEEVGRWWKKDELSEVEEEDEEE